MYVWVGVGFPTQIQYFNLSEWWLKNCRGEGQPSELMYYFSGRSSIGSDDRYPIYVAIRLEAQTTAGDDLRIVK